MANEGRKRAASNWSVNFTRPEMAGLTPATAAQVPAEALVKIFDAVRLAAELR